MHVSHPQFVRCRFARRILQLKCLLNLSPSILGNRNKRWATGSLPDLLLENIVDDGVDAWEAGVEVAAGRLECRDAG